MRFLDGSLVAQSLELHHQQQITSLLATKRTPPRLAILNSGSNLVGKTYIKLKQAYADRIGLKVDLYELDEDQMLAKIQALNSDASVHGIIIQLPLTNTALTYKLCNSIDPAKDIDGLGGRAHYGSATATAIYWLLTSYNIDLKDKEIIIIGRGKLVGIPLAKLFKSLHLKSSFMDESNSDLNSLRSKDIIISATGQPHLIKSKHLKPKAIVIDAGVANVDGVLKGDLDEAIYKTRQDLTITPLKGGVGPLTIACVFDNLIRAWKMGSKR